MTAEGIEQEEKIDGRRPPLQANQIGVTHRRYNERIEGSRPALDFLLAIKP